MDIKGRPPQKKPNKRFSDIRPAKKPTVVAKKPSAPPVTPQPEPQKITPPQNHQPTDEKIVPMRDTKTVEISFSMPKMPKLDAVKDKALSLARLLRKKKVLIGAGIVLAVIILYFAIMALLGQWSMFVDSRTGDFDKAAEQQTPTFDAMLPNDKPIEQLGGWKRVSPPNNDPVFTFIDQIDGVKIQVSQQQVPQSFKEGNVDESVAEMATNFGAKESIKAGGLTLYIGQKFEGQQSVIFRKNDILFSIVSQSKITNKAWGKYALSLR